MANEQAALAMREASERVRTLNIRDASDVMAYGAKAQRDIDTFTSLALARMLETDLAPMERTLELFIARVRDCDVTRIGKGVLSKLFGGGGVRAIREAYEKSAPAIEKSADEMTDMRVALLRDQALLERLEEKNNALYAQLDALCVCGRERLSQLRAAYQPGDANDLIAASRAGDEKAAIDRFERRIADLELTRTACAQLSAQLRIVQESDLRTADKLQSTLTNTLPLWRAQMMTALGMARAMDAMDLQNASARTLRGSIAQNTRTLQSQRKSLAQKAGDAQDMEAAALQSEALLHELEEIERSLKEQTQLREGTAA